MNPDGYDLTQDLEKLEYQPPTTLEIQCRGRHILLNLGELNSWKMLRLVQHHC